MQQELQTRDSNEANRSDRSTTEIGVSKEDIFDVLSNSRRRWTIHYLKNHGEGRVPLREDVDHVTALENGVPVQQIDSTARKNVYTSLRQTHLPKMDEIGIIDYDARRGEIELTGDAEAVEMYLEYVPEAGIPWSEYYLGLSAVAVALVVVTYLRVAPFDVVPWPAVAFLLVGIFGASAVVHTVQTKRNRLGAESALDEDR